MASLQERLDAATAAENETVPLEVRLARASRQEQAAAPPIPMPMATMETSRDVAADIRRAGLQGATFNTADELLAGIKSVLGPQSYEDLLEVERVRLREIPASTSIPAQVGGAFLSAGLTAPAAGVLRGGALARGAQAGALGGAAAGAGAAEGGLGERALGAATGAATGAAVGTALPLAGRALRGGANFLTRGRLAAGGVPAGAAASVPGEERAAAEIERAFRADLMTPARRAAREAALGPQATALDVGGSNVRGLLRAAAGIPGPAKDLAERTLTRRQLGQQQRVISAARSALGVGRRFGDTVDEVVENRAAAARPMYDAALARQPAGGLQFDQTNRLIAENRTIQGLIRRVRAEDPDLADLPDNSLEVLDEVYKELGARAASLRDRLNPQRSGAAAHRLDKLRRTLRDSIIEEVPEYGRALETYSHDSNLLDALMAGRNVLRQEDYMTREMVRNLSGAEREMWLIGVAEGIQDLVERVQNPRDVTRKILGNRQVQSRLRAAIPSQRAWRQFQRELLREGEMAQAGIQARPSTGSQTALRQEEIADLIDPIRQVINTAIRFGTGPAAGVAGGRLAQITARMFGRASKNEQIARQLLSPLSEGARIEQNMLQRALARQLAGQRAATAAFPAANIAGGASSEAVADLLRRR